MNKTESENQSKIIEFDTDDMLLEYDFFGGLRGKHAAAYRNGYRIIIHKQDGSTEEFRGA